MNSHPTYWRIKMSQKAQNDLKSFFLVGFFTVTSMLATRFLLTCAFSYCFIK